ncbi:MAG: cysteine--tRNA ligase [Candidatus Nealsonbacteria bacterium]|nr:cysteine--tRNA ligase [Candidatus Nealsonbacteria bacterium]
MLKLYNTQNRKKEILKPRKDKKINLFVCGPTVYDFSHIGHARTYIGFDVIAKYLKESGYDVFYLQNITDIDDKIIERARKTKIQPKQLAEKFQKEYFKDVKELKITSVSKYAKATDYIKEILSQVQRLMQKGYAYQLEDGIYYDISKFKNYGKLSRRTITQAEDGVSRIDESKNKKNKGDFCLWKKSKAGEPKWRSPWFQGRPGWHIEDTAITEKHFGSQYDIHGGAQDLMFPHHEAEIAQMEAISNKHPFVKYWLHTGFLKVQGQKMAKSLGNFITIRNFLKENDSRTLRLLIIKNHYRSPFDYNEKLLHQTKKELEKIDEFIDKLKNTKTKGKSQKLVYNLKKQFKQAMEDDFNTPKAIALIFNLISKGNTLIGQNKLTMTEAREILNFLKEIDKVFNFIFRIKAKDKIPSSVLSLVNLREKQREKNNWQKADEIRKKIQQLGYQVEDTKDGPKIKKI